MSVALTHRHPDHVGGAYRFDEVMMSVEEDGHWEEAERHAAEHRADGAGATRFSPRRPGRLTRARAPG